jgi:4'-phosphopantetheinyl transferase
VTFATTGAQRVLQAVDALRVWRVRLDDSPAAFEGSLRMLGEDERRRAARFRKAADRTRYVLGRGTLRRLLSMQLEVPAERLAFGANAFGKPFLQAPGPRLHFNSTHSGDWILHAFDTLGPVGIDVEAVRSAFADVEDFAPVLSPEEYLAIARLPLHTHTRALALAWAWVRKEAYVKAIGEGVSRALPRICIRAGEGGKPRLCYDRNAPATPLRWSFEEIAVDAEHVACLVYSSGHGPPAAARTVIIRDLEPRDGL